MTGKNIGIMTDDEAWDIFSEDERRLNEEARLIADDREEIDDLLDLLRHKTGHLSYMATQYLTRLPDTCPMYKPVWENLAVALQRSEEPAVTGVIAYALAHGRINTADWHLVEAAMHTVRANKHTATRIWLVYSFAYAPLAFYAELHRTLLALESDHNLDIRTKARESLKALERRHRTVRPVPTSDLAGQQGAAAYKTLWGWFPKKTSPYRAKSEPTTDFERGSSSPGGWQTLDSVALLDQHNTGDQRAPQPRPSTWTIRLQVKTDNTDASSLRSTGQWHPLYVRIVRPFTSMQADPDQDSTIEGQRFRLEFTDNHELKDRVQWLHGSPSIEFEWPNSGVVCPLKVGETNLNEHNQADRVLLESLQGEVTLTLLTKPDTTN